MITVRDNARSLLASLLLAAMAFGCASGESESDAFGNFEATETLISSEANGRLLKFAVEEGTLLSAGQMIGLVDTTQLYLKRTQLVAMRTAVGSRSANVRAQIGVLEEQRDVANTEKQRIERLVTDGAGTQKQLDDVSGQMRVIERQIQSIRTQNASILGEVEALDAQIAQLDDQLQRCRIVNPAPGTVLETYARVHELTSMGRSLYKLANLDTLLLKAYVSGIQLPDVRLGQRVEVLIDDADEGLLSLDGVVSWISAEAEFTPKLVQTREERVDLVYAIKIRVANSEGRLKIGLPGEVRFASNS